jgi:hypothetical protein
VDGWRLRQWVTIDAVRLAVGPAMVFLVAALDRGYQTELWQHLARGRLCAQERRVVSEERFTFTAPGRTLRDNPWGAPHIPSGLFRAGGIELVQFDNALTLAGAVGVLVGTCRREGVSSRVAGALGACVAVGLWQTVLIRPQSFSVLMFVGLDALLRRARERPAAMWAVPAVMAVWANVHGGFAIGLLLILAHGGPDAAALWVRNGRGSGGWWRWGACLVAAAAATLANPYGWRVYGYAGELSARGVSRGIEEWMPPNLGTLIGTAYVVSLVAVAAVVWRARGRVTLRDACFLGAFAVPACMAVRMAVWWFLVAAPVVAGLLGRSEKCSEIPGENAAASRWRAAVALAGIVAACVASLPWLEAYSPLMRASRLARRTESDLDAVAAALAGEANVFTRMEWANYLGWRTAGRSRVFVEGHVELYPDDVWAEYVTVNDARPGWREVLDRRGVRFLVLDQTYHAALLSEVRRGNDWAPRAAAGPALVFERAAPPAQASGDFSPTD